MTAWNDIWFEVEHIVHTSSSRSEAAQRVSEARGCHTTWDALARAWRRQVDAGVTIGEAHTQLGMDAQPCQVKHDHVPWVACTAEDIDESLEDAKLPAQPKVQGGKPTITLTPREGEKWLIPGDLHFGIQDEISIGLMQACAEDFGIDRVILQGDTFDCYAISRHDQRANRIRGQCYTLADERDEAAPFLDWVRQYEGSKCIPGNHEDRWWALQDKNVGLYKSVDLRTVFSIPEEIEVLPQYARIQAGSLVIEHGHKLPRSLSKYGAHTVLGNHPDQTTIYGHTHRIAEARHTTLDRQGNPRTRMALTIGHMSIPGCHVDYAPDANWQQGFALVEFWKGAQDKLRYTIYVVEIHNHEFRFGERTYR